MEPAAGGQHLTCSFCGRPQAALSYLVAGPGVNICDDCVLTARRTIWARGSAQYVIRLCHPGLSEAWSNYLALLIVLPATAMFLSVVPLLGRLDRTLQGGVALMIAFASLVLCCYFLWLVFAMVAANQAVSRLLVGSTWAGAALVLAQGFTTHLWFAAVTGFFVSQAIVFLRPSRTGATPEQVGRRTTG
jgi:hypothetical protein